jgi:hypothetical protein
VIPEVGQQFNLESLYRTREGIIVTSKEFRSLIITRLPPIHYEVCHEAAHLSVVLLPIMLGDADVKMLG